MSEDIQIHAAEGNHPRESWHSRITIVRSCNRVSSDMNALIADEIE